MSTRAKFVKEIGVIDPDTKGEVHLAVYKHENGGMFAIDSSFVEQKDPHGCPDEEDEITTAVYDPFADFGDPTTLYLEEN
jgi:hypothetical protein